MRRAQFHTQLLASTYAALRFGQTFVDNRLRLDVEYVALLNQSHDAKRADDELVYPNDDGRVHELPTAADVTDLLFRDRRCPAWIDISVLAATRRTTLMRLLCCGRFVDDDQRLYYRERGTQPFGIKSPDLPPSWVGAHFRLPRRKAALSEIRWSR